MQGMRGSFFKSIIINPLVWFGVILTCFTLHYEGFDNAYQIFFQFETYRNLAIGAAIYVALFNRQYKRGGDKLDVKETLLTVLETMYVILFVWGISLFAVVNYHLGGLSYSAGLRERYEAAGWIKNDQAKEDIQAVQEMTGKVLEGMDLEQGKMYKVTPQADGSFIIEVVAE